jgi:L-aminopeptidase/D-esterase-like protein
MAHDGFARSINPVHTMGDGDTIFALATGALGRSANLTVLGALGADVTATAVQRAVRAARSLKLPSGLHLPAAGDLEQQQGDSTT